MRAHRRCDRRAGGAVRGARGGRRRGSARDRACQPDRDAGRPVRGRHHRRAGTVGAAIDRAAPGQAGCAAGGGAARVQPGRPVADERAARPGAATLGGRAGRVLGGGDGGPGGRGPLLPGGGRELPAGGVAAPRRAAPAGDVRRPAGRARGRSGRRRRSRVATRPAGLGPVRHAGGHPRPGRRPDAHRGPGCMRRVRLHRNAARIASSNPAAASLSASRCAARSTNPAETGTPSSIPISRAARSVGTLP